MKKSNVFSAMFTNDMLEKQSKEVNISDISLPAMEELLRFIYTDKFFYFDDDSDYHDLLRAADKYAVKDLKIECENKICDDLSLKNVVKCLILADQHNAHRLKAKSIEFIVKNAKNFVEESEFKEMMQKNSELSYEIFRKIVQKRKSLPVSCSCTTQPNKKKVK